MLQRRHLRSSVRPSANPPACNHRCWPLARAKQCLELQNVQSTVGQCCAERREDSKLTLEGCVVDCYLRLILCWSQKAVRSGLKQCRLLPMCNAQVGRVARNIADEASVRDTCNWNTPGAAVADWLPAPSWAVGGSEFGPRRCVASRSCADFAAERSGRCASLASSALARRCKEGQTADITARCASGCICCSNIMQRNNKYTHDVR